MGHFQTMEALEGWLREIGPRAHLFRCEAAPAPKIEDLKAELLDTHTEIKTMKATADAEGRKLNADEKIRINELWARYDEIKEDIAERERIAEAEAHLSKSLGRQTEPNDKVRMEPAPPPAISSRPVARPITQDERGRRGFQSLGHFALEVRNAGRVMRTGQGNIDPRLVTNAPSTWTQESIGEDGGFAVPPDFRTEIMEKVMAENSLIARTDQLQSSSNTATIPVDETTPWQSTGGVQAYWEGEGDQGSQSKVALKTRSVRLNKIMALCPVTEELLEDAPMMDSFLRRKAPQKIDYKISDAIFAGDGVGKPLGVLNSAGLISISAESGQAADTVVFNNLKNMWSRMYAPWRQNAVWMINQDVEPQLIGLNFPGDSRPVYLPAGTIAGAPFGSILGRPVVPHEVCKTVGDAGDIVLVDWAQYMTITKTSGVRVDTSMHLFFDYDMQAFRFVLRVAGEPWWNAAIDRANGTNTLSWAIAIAART